MVNHRWVPLLVVFASFFNFSMLLKGAVIIPGNSKKNGSFTFSVGPHAFMFNQDLKALVFYVAANEAKEKNKFAIARALATEETPQEKIKFEPMAPKRASINGNDRPNPLFGAKISHLALLGALPVVVKDGATNVILFRTLKGNDLLVSPTLRDANNKNTGGIIGLQTIGNNIIIAAIKNNKGNVFGSPDSGIALIQYSKHEVSKQGGDKKQQKIELRVLNADPDDTTTKVNKAAPLTNGSSVLKINNDVTILSNIIDIRYSKALNRFYITLQVKANTAAGSGARALVVGRVQQGKIILEPIVPDSALTGDNQIVGTAMPDAIVSLYNVRTMNTSTHLDYLIVVGGNGTADTVANRVFALPLVNKMKIAKKLGAENTHGTLAAVNQDPKNFFNEGSFFNGRAFTQAATQPSELFTMNDEAALAGAGPLPLAAGEQITDLFVAGDSVFATIGAPFDGVTEPGLYYSQALFDNKGRIKSWTPWVRTAGTQDQIFGALLNPFDGNFWFMTGKNPTNVTTIKRTTWGLGSSHGLGMESTGLIAYLASKFKQEQGGLHGVFDLPRTTAGLNNFSLMLTTGLGKIAFIESGRIEGGFFRATSGDFVTNNVKTFDGSFPQASPSTKVALVAGGALRDIGPIITAIVATKNATDRHWFVVGGTGGVAILADAQGMGWQGSMSSLADLPTGLSFKQLGNYSFVRKLISDGTFLYVLTDKTLDRIELSAPHIKSGNIQRVMLAAQGLLPGTTDNGSFADVLISGKFALLATSQGLFRVGNGGDITTATSVQAVDWQYVETPESAGPVLKLYPLSTTANEQDVALNGQVYALNAYIGMLQATLNRYDLVLPSSISTTTMQLVPDLYVKGIISSFIDFSNFRNSCTMQGSRLFSTNSLDIQSKLFAQLLPSGIKSGAFHAIHGSIQLPLMLSSPGTIIGSVLRRSASGGLLIWGDFGLRVNE